MVVVHRRRGHLTAVRHWQTTSIEPLATTTDPSTAVLQSEHRPGSRAQFSRIQGPRPRSRIHVGLLAEWAQEGKGQMSIDPQSTFLTIGFGEGHRRSLPVGRLGSRQEWPFQIPCLARCPGCQSKQPSFLHLKNIRPSADLPNRLEWAT